MKTCPKCKRELPEAEFFKNRSRRDGLQDWCKSCMRHLPEIAEYYRLYRSTHRPEIAERMRLHHSAHRPQRAAANRRWRAAHPGAKAAAVQKWNAAHPGAEQAHSALNRAVKRGEIVKLAYCQLCLASPEPRNLVGHHYNGKTLDECYEHPLDVIWLCKVCHAGVHWTPSEMQEAA